VVNTEPPEVGTMADIPLPHVYIVAIADYYDVPALKEQANAKINRILHRGTSRVVDKRHRTTKYT
jgi:hypothetical protein